MRKPCLTLLFIFTAVLATASHAQLCGSFGVTLNVYDNDLKPVAGHSVRIVPWLKDELKGDKFAPVADKPGTSEIKLLEGHVVTGNYKIVVSAPGFLDTEKSITFPHCTRLSYDILLLRKKEKFAMVSGHVGDDEGKSVAYAGVTVTGADGVERYVSTDFIGNYEIKLKPGKYVVEARAPYRHITRAEKFIVPETGRGELHLLMTTLKRGEEKRVIIQKIPRN